MVNQVTLTEMKRGYCPGQAIARKFKAHVLDNCAAPPRQLGDAPLIVEGISPGAHIQIIDPLEKEIWIGEMSASDTVKSAVVSSLSEYTMRDKLLNGKLKLRAKLWQTGDKEVTFLSNKPERRFIKIKLQSKGDTIALQNIHGVKYAVTR